MLVLLTATDNIIEEACNQLEFALNAKNEVLFFQMCLFFFVVFCNSLNFLRASHAIVGAE
jgi:hypothetical protein